MDFTFLSKMDWADAFLAVALFFITFFLLIMTVALIKELTSTSDTTTATASKKGGFFHRVGILFSLLGALLGADLVFQLNLTSYVVMAIEVAEEVAARRNGSSEKTSSHSAPLCEEDEDHCFSEAEVDTAAAADEGVDEGAEKVVTTPRARNLHTSRPHRTSRPRSRSGKSAKEEMCQRLRLVGRMVRKVAGGDHHSPREAAREKVDNLIYHANGRPSRIQEICGI